VQPPSRWLANARPRTSCCSRCAARHSPPATFLRRTRPRHDELLRRDRPPTAADTRLHDAG
jgi:hypothetical protein